MFMHNYCVHQERLKSNMATITAVKVFTFCALLAITKGMLCFCRLYDNM